MRASRVVAGVLLAGGLAGCLGGPVTQSPSCATYVACMRALDADAGTTTNLDRFLPGGACWVNSVTGDGCATGCQRGVAWLQARQAPLPAECAL